MSKKISLELAVNDSNMVIVELPVLEEDKLKRLEALERPLDEEHTDFINSGYLPDSFALFEYDAKLILRQQIPPELQSFMRQEDGVKEMEEVKANFDRHIKDEESLHTYLRYCRAAFFIEGAVQLDCTFRMQDYPITIDNPQNACFITGEERKFLQQFPQKNWGYIQDYPVIIDPLQIARKDLSMIKMKCISRLPMIIPFAGQFPIQSESSNININNGIVTLSEGDKICELYLVPIKKGTEEVTVTYNCAGQPQTTGKITINIV